MTVSAPPGAGAATQFLVAVNRVFPATVMGTGQFRQIHGRHVCDLRRQYQVTHPLSPISLPAQPGDIVGAMGYAYIFCLHVKIKAVVTAVPAYAALLHAAEG